VENVTMTERVKIFTFITGHGETLIDPPLEEHINKWLEQSEGELVEITQSESQHTGGAHHVTVCLWYLPPEKQPRRKATPKKSE
jgi:hypothetical protein